MPDQSNNQWAIYKERLARELNERRYEHSLRVAATAKELAEFWGENAQKAELAGLLHDVARGLSVEDYYKIAQEAGIEVTEAEKINPVVLHAPIGAYLLQKEWGIEDEEILEAVAGHTVAGPSMSNFSKIIFLADMIEPGRNWPVLKKIRRLAYLDLNEAMLVSLSAVFDWLRKSGSNIHPFAYRAHEYFRQQVEDRDNQKST
ncbi:MAG: bis(5'-nucleosyl)-tetraphosphatase (symmetrical) YqeK [Bacillota bacterium]|jgi:predicted HD superfamily hydrolase involved in NAD metabolism